jgi:hypothetical protein
VSTAPTEHHLLALSQSLGRFLAGSRRMPEHLEAKARKQIADKAAENATRDAATVR